MSGLLLAVALSMDVGNMVNVRDELGTAVDAAALAGARALYDPIGGESRVRNAAKRAGDANRLPSLSTNDRKDIRLQANMANDSSSGVVLGTYDFETGSFKPQPLPVDMTQVNAVEVTARLGDVASPLPLTFGRLSGVETFDTTRRALAILAGPSEAQPTVPMTINKDVFSGQLKGFAPPNEIRVSTKTNMEWTGYFGATNASDLVGLVEDPKRIPKVRKNDVISRANGTENSVCHAMDDKYRRGDVIVAPVTDFATKKITGFAVIRITEIQCGGEPKYIDGELVAYQDKANGMAGLAECYGLSCRSILVN